MVAFPPEPTCKSSPTPLDCLSGTLLNRAVIQLRSSASVLFWLRVKQITLCMHEYITSAAVIIPGKAMAFGTCAPLPRWRLRPHCRRRTIKWVWMWGARVSTGIRCRFMYREPLLIGFVGVRLTWWNIHGIETGLLRFSSTLRLSDFYDPQYYRQQYAAIASLPSPVFSIGFAVLWGLH